MDDLPGTPLALPADDEKSQAERFRPAEIVPAYASKQKPDVVAVVVLALAMHRAGEL